MYKRQVVARCRHVSLLRSVEKIGPQSTRSPIVLHQSAYVAAVGEGDVPRGGLLRQARHGDDLAGERDQKASSGLVSLSSFASARSYWGLPVNPWRLSLIHI